MNNSTSLNDTINQNMTTSVSTSQVQQAGHLTVADQVPALLIVVFFAAAGGILIGSLQGFQFPKIWKFPGYELKPVIKGIVIPPLVIMIIFGCICKNFFGESVQNYPSAFTKQIRGFCLCILLIRGGLQVEFSGKGPVVFFLSFMP